MNCECNVGFSLLALKTLCETRVICKNSRTGDTCPMYEFCARYDISPCTWDGKELPNVVINLDIKEIG